MAKTQITMQVAKVDDSDNMVYAWGMINTKNGEDYYDTDNQHFPKEVTIKACIDFMRNARVHKAMHKGAQVGEVVFMFPAHDEVLKQFGVNDLGQEGMWIGIQVDDEDVMTKFRDGTYADVSMGGGASFEDVE